MKLKDVEIKCPICKNTILLLSTFLETTSKMNNFGPSLKSISIEGLTHQHLWCSKCAEDYGTIAITLFDDDFNKKKCIINILEEEGEMK